MVSDSDWTVLLIGGASATGKTTLARALAPHLDAQVLEADLFWIVLQRAITAEVAPELHFYDHDDAWSKPVETLVDAYLEAAATVCHAIEVLVAHQCAIGQRAILEGAWILPAFARQDSYAGHDGLGSQVRAVFLHERLKPEMQRRLAARDARAAGSAHNHRSPAHAG